MTPTPTGVPGVVETVERYGETTLVVDPARVVEACTHLRDVEGFNVLVDVSGVDYLGWGGKQVAGYLGTAAGRDLNAPGSQGFERVPDPKPKRFAVSRICLAPSAFPMLQNTELTEYASALSRSIVPNGEVVSKLFTRFP